ncbi:hypothetical protein pipiens_003681 [Culex pipiens pipiens]|uniref:Uncharacterized protein n=1 Tax=Culex pipiens pipiens TaxID=38569 RepID=A0ABD1CU66_CULPP
MALQLTVLTVATILVTTALVSSHPLESDYRKYLRTRPPQAPGEVHVEEVLEVFRTRARPPAYGVYSAGVNAFLANSALQRSKVTRPLTTRSVASTTTSTTTTTVRPTRTTFPTPTRNNVNPDYTNPFQPSISMTKYPSYKAPKTIIIQEGSTGCSKGRMEGQAVTTERVPDEEVLEEDDTYSYSNEEYFDQITTVRPTVYPPSNVEYCDPEQEPISTESSNEFEGQRSGIGSFIKDKFNKLKSGKSDTSKTNKPTKPTVHTTTKRTFHTTTKPRPNPVSVSTEKHHTVKPTHHESHPADHTEKSGKRRRKKILKVGSDAWKAAKLALEGVQMGVQAAELKDQVMARLKGTTTTTTAPKPEYEYFYEEDDEAGESDGVIEAPKS